MIPALLLTGGASRRMGQDKALIGIDGEPLAVRTARVLAEVCEPVIEVGSGRTGLPCVTEEPPGGGPLAALVAGSAVLPDDGPILVVACDVPRLDASVLRLLAGHPGASTVVPEADGRLQVLCARYGPEARAAAPQVLADGGRSMVALLEQTRYEVLDEEAWSAVVDAEVFGDLDTPEDLERYRGASRDGGVGR
jgi:molybdopterin-guanine dinucleotide biosynthesis protein A